jgi:hypothetical protein
VSRVAFLLLVLCAARSATAQVASNQCPADYGPATLFGPAMSRADSGRIYSYTLSPDGREFYFFKKVGERRSEDYRIFRAVRQGTGWSAPEQLLLGVDASDLYPSLSPDGSRLVFSSYRPVPGDTSSHPNAHLYMARRQGNGWSTPQLLSASRIGFYHSGLQQLADGTLTFGLTTPDWRSNTRMELAWNGTSFAAAMVASPPIPAVEYWRGRSGDSIHVWHATMAPSGAALLGVSRVTQPASRRGPARYFVSRPLPDGSWTPMTPAGAGLGTGSPNFGWFSADGCWFHYTRDYSEFHRVSVAEVLRPTQ